ncbi:MAG: hypothetical protein M5U34_13890 [Chloroflexi bacterium]|nr:hypothetical protein [Chloroflexota bacterium]
MRLQAELDAAQRSLSSWQQTNSSSATQMETLSVEPDKANGEIGVLSGLVALYEQLDDVDVAELMTAGGNGRFRIDQQPDRRFTPYWPRASSPDSKL